MSLPWLPALLLGALLLIPGRPLRADEKPEVNEFKARRGNMTATAISDDGKLLFTGEDDGLVTLWSVTSGSDVKDFPGHSRGVFAAALLPDGRRGVTCGDDNLIIVWDLAGGRLIRQMSTGLAIPWVMACNTAGTLAATGCDDGQIAVWNLDNGRRVATLRHHSPVYGLQFSPDDRVLASSYLDGHVILWNTAGWTERKTLPDAGQASVGALAFSPDSRLLATGNQSGAGFVWNVSDGSLFSSFAGYANPEATPSPPAAPVFPGSVITPDNRSAIVFLCFSRNGKTMLGSIQDAPARFWDTQTGKFLGTADWFEDNRLYIARYGFTFATAAVTPRRDYLVTTKENLAQVWRCSWTPNPPPQ